MTMKRDDIPAVAHVHSTWSYDGKWTLDQLAEIFARRKARVLLMSEHDRGFDESRWQAYRQACRAASTDQILLVPGMEYSDPSNTVHLLVWGAASFLGESLASEQLLERANREDAFVVLAHPARKNAWRCVTSQWRDHIHGVEVWNRKSDGFASSNEGWTLVDEQGWQPFFGLDFHRARQFFPLVTRLNGLTDLTEAEVIRALHAGQTSAEAFGLAAGRFKSGPWAMASCVAENGRRLAVRVLAPFRGKRIHSVKQSRSDSALNGGAGIIARRDNRCG